MSLAQRERPDCLEEMADSTPHVDIKGNSGKGAKRNGVPSTETFYHLRRNYLNRMLAEL